MRRVVFYVGAAILIATLSGVAQAKNPWNPRTDYTNYLRHERVTEQRRWRSWARSNGSGLMSRQRYNYVHHGRYGTHLRPRPGEVMARTPFGRMQQLRNMDYRSGRR